MTTANLKFIYFSTLSALSSKKKNNFIFVAFII